MLCVAVGSGFTLTVTVGKVVSAATEPEIVPKLLMPAELPAASVMEKSILLGVIAPVSGEATVKTMLSPAEFEALASCVTAVEILLAVEAELIDAVTASL